MDFFPFSLIKVIKKDKKKIDECVQHKGYPQSFCFKFAYLFNKAVLLKLTQCDNDTANQSSCVEDLYELNRPNQLFINLLLVAI